MAKKDERLTLPEQQRIPTEVKRALVLTAEADRRPLQDQIIFLIEFGLKLRSALVSKEVIVRISHLPSGDGIRGFEAER